MQRLCFFRVTAPNPARTLANTMKEPTRVHWLGGKPDKIYADTSGGYKPFLVLRKLRLVPVTREISDRETLEEIEAGIRTKISQ